MTEPCQRYEKEALLRLERGEALGEHFESCPDCLAAAKSYEALGAQLRNGAEGLEPPGDWQAKVWSRIARRRAAEQRRQRIRTGWIRVGWAGALTVLIFALAWPLMGPSGKLPSRLEAPTLTVQILASASNVVRRGLEAQPGDEIMVTSPVADGQPLEIWIFRNDRELLLRCSTGGTEPNQGCQISEKGTQTELQARLVMENRGRYQSLAFSGLTGEEIERLGIDRDGDLDSQSARLLDGGALISLGEEISVR